MTHGLPQGWAWAPLGGISLPRVTWNPKTATKNDFAYIDIESVDNVRQHIDSPKRLTVTAAPSRARVSVGKGDILFSLVRPYLKNIAVVPETLDGEVASTAFVAVKPAEGIESAFVFHQLLQDRLIASVPTYGNSPPAARDDEFFGLHIAIAPTAEQHRIAEKLEELLTDLDSSNAALKRARANLKRYRAAILKAAVEGKLTAEWRKANRPSEPADKLLERILVERRAKWEDAQVAKAEATGVALSKAWQKRYKAPPAQEEEFLPEIPASWRWISLGTVAWQIRDGPHYSPQYSEEGIPFISGGNVRSDGIDLAGAKRISHELHKELSLRCKPEYGDLLYTKGGTTGIARINTEEREFNVWVHVAVLKLVDSVDKQYLQHVLNSPFCYSQSQRYTHGVGNQDLGLTRMIKIALPLPPLAEQHAIVGEIEQRVSLLNSLENELDASLRRSTRLRQAILKRAFEGKLVPQDPNDEPASVLLERIRAARASDQLSGKPHRTRKANQKQRPGTADSSKSPQPRTRKPAKRDVFAELVEGFDALKRERDG